MLVSLVVRRGKQPHSPGHMPYLSSPKWFAAGRAPGGDHREVSFFPPVIPARNRTHHPPTDPPALPVVRSHLNPERGPEDRQPCPSRDDPTTHSTNSPTSRSSGSQNCCSPATA